MKLGRNDPCWCESGKKYKKCHLVREREKPMPFPAVLGSIRSFFNIKECLHPLASKAICGKIIAAHTIQRQGALAKLVDKSGHYLTFYQQPANKLLEPQRRGWREASTFAGFCDRHDSSTFAPLEKYPFTGTAEQCFLLAYRAECHELYQKQASSRTQNTILSLVDRGMSPEDQMIMQTRQQIVGDGVKKGLSDSRHYKRIMDAEFIERRFDAYAKLFIQFEGDIVVAGTGASTTNRSLSGEELFSLHDPNALIPRLYVGVVPSKSGGAAVLIWRRNDSVTERFIRDLYQLPRKELSSVIVQFIFAYIENTYFSDKWWSTLTSEEQAHVRTLATMGNPYYTAWSYRKLTLPWQVTNFSGDWSIAG